MSDTDTSTTQLVVFTLGGKEYALPITEVHEIIRWVEPRPVSSDTEWIRGVISLRGKIIPVCDLSSRLGLTDEPVAEPKIVIVETGGETAGVLVDEVEEVLTIGADQLEDAPPAAGEALRSIAKLEDKLMLLLDNMALFAAARSLPA